MVSPKLKIGLLLAVHLAVGIPLSCAAYVLRLGFETAGAVFWAVVLAETGLLGIWGAFGATRPIWRIPVVLAATTCLGVVTAAAERSRDEIDMAVVVAVALPAMVVFVVLCILRYGRRKLQLLPSSSWPATSEGFQFTLRHLLLVTAVVAVVFGIGQGTRAIPTPDLYDGSWVMLFILIVNRGLSPIAVDLATLWAALGNGRPARRLAVVVPAAFGLGLLPPLFLQGSGWRDFVGWSFIIGFQATITAASLLVIRSCGWRLVRTAAEQPASSTVEVLT